MTKDRFCVAILAALVFAAQTRAADPLPTRVESVLSLPGYKDAHWGLLVVDAKTGETVYERNADQMFCPASVTKVFSCAAAMSELGPDFRFETPVVRRGEIDSQGVLKGDLILVAKGDLSLGGRTGPDGKLHFEDNDHSYAGSVGTSSATLVPLDPLAGLDHLAREVKEAGIKSITGDVMIDDRIFENAPSSGSGPAHVSSIVINDNVIDVKVTPATKAGEPATVEIVPKTAFISVDERVDTVEEGGKPSISVHSVGPRRFTVRGKIPVGHKPVVKIYEVEEPAEFARSLFIEALRRRGVGVPASPLSGNPSGSLPARSEVANLPKLATYTSPPFREYIRIILKVSQNLHASTLPMLLAAKHNETSLIAGLKREGVALRALGVDTTAVSFGGGAGGARADLVTPRSTVTLLRALKKRADFPTFEEALPVLGRDGTLAKAVPADSPARGHARAKTGTYSVGDPLNGRTILTSKALAGYLETASGRDLVFTFFLNNVPMKGGDDTSAETLAAGQVLGKLCEVFYLDDTNESAKPAAGVAPKGSN